MPVSGPLSSPALAGTSPAAATRGQRPQGATFHQHLQRAGPPPAPDVSGPAGPLRRPPGPDLPGELTTLLGKIRADEKRLDGYLRRARAGADFELSELVTMQSLVHRYTQRVELLSKLVDRVTGSIRQALQTQL